MSKPLELTVHPPAACACHWVENPWTYYGIVEPGGAMEPNPECPEHFPSHAKRLTDAELAAEYWKFCSGFHDGRGVGANERLMTLIRFCTTPSYDEGSEP